MRTNGLQAFRQGRYGEAIDAWRQATELVPAQAPTEALAEARFRRGAEQAAPNEAALADLQEAVKLQPGDPLYLYHLGLVAHRQGQYGLALDSYAAAYKQADAGLKKRIAYPYCLVVLQQGQEPAGCSAWPALTAEEQTMLTRADAFRRRPFNLPDNAPPLWLGMAALDQGDDELAGRHLEEALSTAGNPYGKSVAHYYLGVMAAGREEWSEARRHWLEAYRAGDATNLQERPWLAENLGELFHRLAEERLEEGDAKSAIAAAQEAARFSGANNKLNEARSHAHQRIAYQAASEGQWQTARNHWEKAQELEGGSFRLAYNLALAYERDERFMAAAEAWREALRRRPRRDDHPDAINDEQVARLWQRCAEAYRRAEEYDEAVQVYRHAVKWQPENSDMRLALAEGLLANGQSQAAQNELDRLLERDPNNVKALLRQGEVISHNSHWWRRNAALSYWQRALAADPENDEARDLIVDHHRNQAQFFIRWGDYEEAKRLYEVALEYHPDNGLLLAELGDFYLRLDDEDAAHEYMEKGLEKSPRDLDVYYHVICTWLEWEEEDAAWEIMERAEANISQIPYEFYVSVGRFCLMEESHHMAYLWFERAVEVAPSEEDVLLFIGETALYANAIDIAEEYLKRAIAERQSPGQANLSLSLVAHRRGNEKAAKRYLQTAEKLARRTKDKELLERIDAARLIFSSPIGALMQRMMNAGPGGMDIDNLPDPETMAHLLNDLLDEDDDLYDYRK